MKTYTVLLAEDVPHYGFAEVTAASAAEALTVARTLDTGDVCTDPDWSAAVCRRIVHIEAEDGTLVASDVALDVLSVRNGGDQHRLLCNAVLLEALQTAIRAMNAAPSFPTDIPDPKRAGKMLTSYRLLPKLEAIVRLARGAS